MAFKNCYLLTYLYKYYDYTYNISNMLQKYSNENNVIVSTLVKDLKKMNIAYGKGNPLVTDDVYDHLVSILENKSPNHPFLSTIGFTPTRKTVTLPLKMASLNKIRYDEIDKLNNFKKKYAGPYICMDKLDGISALYDSVNNKLYTRGNGTEGRDISHIINRIKGLGEYAGIVRGELIMKKEDFHIYDGGMKNIRNAVTGLVNKSNPDAKLIAMVEFVCYEILTGPLVNKDIVSQVNYIKKNGFICVWVGLCNTISMEKLKRLMMSRTESSCYDIDGIVIKDKTYPYSPIKGYVKNPSHIFAFKLQNLLDIKQTIVTSVAWQISKHGLLKPVVHFNKICINSSEINAATGYNAKYITDNKIGIGSVIKVARSGNVIPKIIEVVKGAVAAIPPYPYKWNDTKVDMVIVGDHEDIACKVISHFFYKLNIKYMQGKSISKCIKEGYDTIILLLEAILQVPSPLENIEGLGKASIAKVRDQCLKIIPNAPIYDLIAASGIMPRGIGSKKMKLLMEYWPSVLTDYKTMVKDDIINKIKEVFGFEHKTSVYVFDNLPAIDKWILDLSAHINIDMTAVGIVSDNANTQSYRGQVIVFSGFRNKELLASLEEKGAKVGSSVSGKTTLLISNGNKDTSKYTKAVKLGTKIVNIKDFVL